MLLAACQSWLPTATHKWQDLQATMTLLHEIAEVISIVAAKQDLQCYILRWVVSKDFILHTSGHLPGVHIYTNRQSQQLHTRYDNSLHLKPPTSTNLQSPFFVLSSSIALALPGQWSSHLSVQIPTDMLGMVHLHHRHVCDEIPLPWHWISGLGPGMPTSLDVGPKWSKSQLNPYP